MQVWIQIPVAQSLIDDTPSQGSIEAMLHKQLEHLPTFNIYLLGSCCVHVSLAIIIDYNNS